MYDCVIIGGGPAGLTSAIYTARAGLSVLLIESEVLGGRTLTTPLIENIPGFKEISGEDFSAKMSEQVEYQFNKNGKSKYSESIEVVTEIIVIDKPEELKNTFIVKTDLGNQYECKSVIIASGTTPRLLNIPGEEDLIGKRLHFCVTCDGPLYEGKEVIVIGGGNSAVTEAIDLAKICKKVTIIQDLKYLTAENTLVKTLKDLDNIEIICDTIPRYYFEENGKPGLAFENYRDELVKLSADGIFLAIGFIPNTKAFYSAVSVDAKGRIIVADKDQSTTTKGIFAAGDCTDDGFNQIVVACGNGAIAAMSAIKYVN